MTTAKVQNMTERVAGAPIETHIIQQDVGFESL
jgi:hypothetical protein